MAASLRGGLPAWLGFLAACLIGAAPVLVVFGPTVLSPSATGWLLLHPFSDDPALYVLAWDAFRHGPLRWPPAANPDFGLELASSIYYADVIPLLALAIKATGGGPAVAQFWGVWLLAAGVLQAVVGWAVAGLATRDPVARAAVAGLVAWQPMLLFRMAFHFTLAGQFLLCLALFLAFRRASGPRQAIAWCALILVVSLVHSYFLVMVGAVWFGDWIGRLGRDGRPGALLGEALAVVGLALGGLWLGGFFLLTDGHVTGAYGAYNLDLLAPFDGGFWSRLLPALPRPNHTETGGSYLGLGTIGLLLAGGVLAWRHGWLGPALRDNGPLLGVLLLMTVFAVTHQVTLGGRALVTVPLPDLLVQGASLLRASERFLWPLAYAAMLAAALVVVRAAGRRAGLVLAGLLVLQALDVSPGLARLRSAFAEVPRVAPAVAQDPFWQQAASRYVRLRGAPSVAVAPDWKPGARLASELRLPTDIVFLARVDVRVLTAVAARTEEELRSGRHERGTLYLLRSQDMRLIAEAGLDPARDLLQEVDSFTVLAPGWWIRPAAAPAP